MEHISTVQVSKPFVTDLDPLCSELVVYFDDESPIGPTLPVRVRIFQYLDEPHRCRPLSKETDFTRIVDKIRFGHIRPSLDNRLPTLVSLRSVFASLNPASLDKVLETPPWSPDNPNPLYAMVMGSYSHWSSYIPVLKNFNKNIFAAMFLYKDRLPLCTMVPKFDGIFVHQPQIIKDSSGDAIKIVVGRDNFYDFGFLKVDSSIWKLFWSNVIKKKPEYDRKLEWNLNTVYKDSDDIGTILFTLTYVLAREEHRHPWINDVKVGIVWEDEPEGWSLNIWSAIICLFYHVRLGAWQGARNIGEGPFPLSLRATIPH